MSAFARLQLPEDRILMCAAPRRKHKRNGYRSRVICEKPALHGFGCLVPPSQATDSLSHLIKREAHRHSGRDGAGKWYFWTEER